MSEPIPPFDLYAELEVAPAASAATIDAAWRSLVKRHHPDALTDPGDRAAAQERIRRLNVAHDWLSEPLRRVRYDAERSVAAAHQRAGVARPAQAPSVDWREVRREAHRRRRPAASSASLVTSPIFVAAFALLVIVLAVGSVAALARLTASGHASAGPGNDPPLGGTGRPTITERPVATPSALGPNAADELAATLPDRIGGIPLSGASGVGVDLFGSDAGGIEELVMRAGGAPEDVTAAYKAGAADDGRFVSAVALSLRSVSGAALADAFRSMTDEDPDVPVEWSETIVGGREVAVSRDVADPQVAAYLLASEAAMYLVIASEAALADEAVRALP